MCKQGIKIESCIKVNFLINENIKKLNNFKLMVRNDLYKRISDPNLHALRLKDLNIPSQFNCKLAFASLNFYFAMSLSKITYVP
jgi:hypothetical protein